MFCRHLVAKRCTLTCYFQSGLGFIQDRTICPKTNVHSKQNWTVLNLTTKSSSFLIPGKYLTFCYRQITLVNACGVADDCTAPIHYSAAIPHCSAIYTNHRYWGRFGSTWHGGFHFDSGFLVQLEMLIQDLTQLRHWIQLKVLPSCSICCILQSVHLILKPRQNAQLFSLLLWQCRPGSNPTHTLLWDNVLIQVGPSYFFTLWVGTSWS